MLDPQTVAWLAGLLEGEAHFSAVKGSVKIVIGMTDRDIIERVATIFRSRIYTVNKQLANPNHKTAYVTACCNTCRAAGLMMTVYRFMGHRRRAKIKEALHQWQTYVPKPKPYLPRRPPECIHGHPFTPENTKRYIGANGREWRACMACRKRLWIERGERLRLVRISRRHQPSERLPFSA